MEDLMEGKKRRVAHNPTNVDPSSLVKSKLKKQLDARRAETETDPKGRTVGHTLKGMPRLAHKPKGKIFHSYCL